MSLAGCAAHGPQPLRENDPLTPLETSFQRLRLWDDQLRLLSALDHAPPSVLSAAALHDSLTATRATYRLRRDAVDPGHLSSEDAAALQVMDHEVVPLLGRSANANSRTPAVDCRRSPDGPLRALTEHTVTCYGRVAEAIIIDRDTLNRLAILGLLPRTADPARRRRLFMALQPVWQSVDGRGDDRSPYRRMLRLRRTAWGDTLSPIDAKAPAFGLRTAELEQWLEQALGRWRTAMPDTLLEPWDWYYAAGEATRKLTPRIARLDQVRLVNDDFYRSFGADPGQLRVGYDLTARPGKYPVAYTDFGSRNRWEAGRWVLGEPWIFTSYLAGGFDNLAELLHESGHAIHIAGLHTRPAYLDWPDNDTFTEAIADLAALDLYEPAWQQRFLGDSVSLTVSIRAKYASIVFDLAWALFEIRVHGSPDADPNAIWAEITSRYLGIKPHPEWSWWAMRGQLIDGPGYLINYALGAFIAADMRAEIARRWGPLFMTDGKRYQRLTATVYRFGLERSSREVMEGFLRRPLSPDALLSDLGRLPHP